MDVRKKPMDVKVHVTTGEGVEVTWSDGHLSRYPFHYLRDLCPCALCNDERDKKARMGAASDGEGRKRRGELRDSDSVFRRARNRNLQLRASARDLPVRGLQPGFSLGNERNHGVDLMLPVPQAVALLAVASR